MAIAIATLKNYDWLIDCDCIECRDDQFQCPNGLCINTTQICDGVVDCGDWSEEMNCSKL